jgi:hypothetical protein
VSVIILKEASQSLTEVLLAVATAIGALGGFVTILLNLKQGKKNAVKIDTVHELVNAKSENQEKRIDQLTGSLSDAGVKIPTKPVSETT